MEDNIKIYDVQLEDWQEGVFATSLVDKPAIGSDFVFFSDDKQIMFFANEEKREVVGAIMIPDVLIPRKDEYSGEIYYVRFSKDVIEGLNERMKEIGYDKSFTFAHAYSAQGNVTLLESWIKEFDEDKSNAYGFDLPIGTMFMKVKITEDTLWNMVKEKKLNGFSIELNASYKLNEELTNTQEMSMIEMFEQSLVVGENQLAWMGDEAISESTVLFHIEKETVDEKEVEKRSRFSGNFELEGKVYNAENGVVTITEKEVEKPVETEKFSIDELLEGINKAIDERLAPITAKLEDIDTKNEEFSQGIEDVKLLTKQKQIVKEEIKDTFEEAVVDVIGNGKVLNEWRAKFGR